MALNKQDNSNSLLSKISKIKNSFGLQVTWTALAASLILTGCLNRHSEKNYANDRDLESKLTTMLKDYSENKWDKFNNKIVSLEEINSMENLAKEISFSLSSIPNLEKKAIFIDLDWATWVVVNETLKKLSYNTTLNYYINWSDNRNDNEVVKYDRLFSLVSKYNLTKEDDHFIEENNWSIKTKPWAIMLDYNRVPDNSEIDYYIDSWNTLYNLYQLTTNDLPNQDIFLDKEDQIRDWVVLVTYWEWINQDIKAYLYTLVSSGIDVKIISITNNHINWLDEEKFAEYNREITQILAVTPGTNQQNPATTHHSWWTVVPYYLYWSGYQRMPLSNTSSFTPTYPSSTKNFNSVTFRDFYTRGTDAFSWLSSSSSKLSNSISSSRVSWAKWWIS